jgi:hypothetical protein
MSLVYRMMVLYFAIAIVEYAFGMPTAFSSLMTGTLTIQTVMNSITQSTMLAAGAAIVSSGLISGTFLAPYILFAPLAVFLGSFFTFSSSVFNPVGAPPELLLLLNAVNFMLNFLLAFSVVSWFKGNE